MPKVLFFKSGLSRVN